VPNENEPTGALADPRVQDLLAQAEEADQQKLRDREDVLSTRERLMQHLHESRHKVKYGEDDAYVVEIRLLSPSEQIWLRKLGSKFNDIIIQSSKIAKRKTTTEKQRQKQQHDLEKIQQEAEVLFDKQYHLLGDICVDPELDYAYWKKGDGYLNYVPSLIIGEALSRSTELTGERVTQARFFRGNP